MRLTKRNGKTDITVQVVTRMVLVSLGAAVPAAADVDLSLHPVEDPVAVGQTVAITLTATNHSDEVQQVGAIDVILHWNPDKLGPIAVNNNGPYSWIVSGFLPDPDGINAAFDDGDALYTALASASSPASIPAHGQLIVTTFEFEAIAAAEDTPIDIVAEQGQFAKTRVLAPNPPQLDVLGTFEGASVTLAACGTADFNSDEDVDLEDFAAFQVCFTGDGIAASSACQCVFDSEPLDGDVDPEDFSSFVPLFTGPAGS